MGTKRGAIALGLLCACHTSVDDGAGFGTGGHEASTSEGETPGSSGAFDDQGSSDATDGAPGQDTDDAKFDVGVETTGEAGRPTCHVVDDMNAVPPCSETAPPDSFDPDIQWVWEGADGNTQVVVTPIVGNLTDDNGDGVVDLCDVPDIVVVAYAADFDNFGNKFLAPARLYVLDGATGALHFEASEPVSSVVTPAIADIDGDGVMEIVAGSPNEPNVNHGGLQAFENDGSLAWKTEPYPAIDGAVAIADLDADGHVEIVQNGHVFDAHGALVWKGGTTNEYGSIAGAGPKSSPVPVDLDADGKLEVVWGDVVHRHDGTVLFAQPELGSIVHGEAHNWPHVADLDADGLPEVLLVRWYGGGRILEHDGTPKKTTPLFRMPTAIHDANGDQQPDILSGSDQVFGLFAADLGEIWTTPIQDLSGAAGTTAFDFLGDGTAEAVYADENWLRIYDASGTVLLEVPRDSWTSHEYPVVADVDNDGSAEIVVVSNKGWNDIQSSPAVQVVRDARDRWVGARRIWNQDAYFVTNVREDGTIPASPVPNWTTLNTFRTQAQLEGGGVCKPEPEG